MLSLVWDESHLPHKTIRRAVGSQLRVSPELVVGQGWRRFDLFPAQSPDETLLPELVVDGVIAGHAAAELFDISSAEFY